MIHPDTIGITSFKTTDFGLRGELFKEKEDFIVEEIETDGQVLSIKREDKDTTQSFGKKDFLCFTLVKNGLSTSEALKFISKDNNINITRIGYQGNKDRNAITAQRISIFKFDANRLKKEYPRMFLKDFEYSENACKIGGLYGNRFTVKIRNFSGSEENLRKFIVEASNGIPNFYGPQHFGASALNIELSKAILDADFKTATIKFLTEDRDEGVSAKKNRDLIREIFLEYLSTGKEINKSEASEKLNGLPGFFYLEKKILNSLFLNSHDHVGAFRLIPKYLRLLILQSFQAYLFNLTLSEISGEKNLPRELPTIGYDLDLDKQPTEIKDKIQKVLFGQGIESLDKFKIQKMPEASIKTFDRDTLIYPKNISYSFDGDNLILSFDLTKGAYATIFLLEMLRDFN
jgi:tRNA pseudouridine13 synthase